MNVEQPRNAQPCSIGINKTLTGPARFCEARFARIAGTRRGVLRIVATATLVALVVAGCGGSARSSRRTTGELPRVLAGEWARQASAVADAAATGDDCRALHLASSLRDNVIQEASKVPSQLRSQLLAGVNALADRIVCTVPPQTVTAPPGKREPPKPPPGHGGHHKHGDNNQGEG